MTQLSLGDVIVTSVVEIDRSSFPTPSMLPDSTADAVARHFTWLKPDFFDERTGDLGSRIQTFVVRTPERLVLIDTCVGNDKDRDGAAAWHMRRGGWLDDLRAAGVTPEQVDLVVCTHLHVDHVGWNTRLVGGRWIPTFPNATYLFVGDEWEFWRHEAVRAAGRRGAGAPAVRGEPANEHACIADSVVPIVEAGRARLVASDHVIDRWLRLEPTPGHTPGHACVRLTTTAGDAVFSGDLMHRVVQVAEPQWSSRFCYDGKRAAVTRREFLERHADTGTLILAAHFPRPGYVVREAGGLRFRAASA